MTIGNAEFIDLGGQKILDAGQVRSAYTVKFSEFNNPSSQEIQTGIFFTQGADVIRKPGLAC